MNFTLDLNTSQMEELRSRISEEDYIERELTSKEGIKLYLYLDVAELDIIHCVALKTDNEHWPWHLAMTRKFELFVYEELADETEEVY